MDDRAEPPRSTYLQCFLPLSELTVALESSVDFVCEVVVNTASQHPSLFLKRVHDENSSFLMAMANRCGPPAHGTRFVPPRDFILSTPARSGGRTWWLEPSQGDPSAGIKNFFASIRSFTHTRTYTRSTHTVLPTSWCLTRFGFGQRRCT